MKKILTVSVLAMAAVGAANATIVSESMLSSNGNKYSSEYTVENDIDAVAAASVAIDQGEGNENKIMVTNSSGQVTPVATIPASQVSGLSTALSDKVAVAQNVSNGVMVTDGSGNVTAAETIAQEKVSGLTSALNDKQDVSNMVTAITGTEYNSALGSTDLYPSMKTAGKMISNAMGTTTTDITNLQNTYVKHSSNTAAGSATVPVYVAEDGTATPITSYAGNAATATNVAWSGVTNKPTINGESMETNVVLDAADVGAVPLAQGNDANHQNKAMITDGTGNVTVGTIATGMITDGAVTKGKLDSSVQASLDKADSAIQSHQDISGKQDVDNMVTAITGPEYNSALGSTDLYPSMKTAGQMITNSLSQTVTDVANLKTGKQNKLSSENGGNVTVSGNTGFVQTVTAADGVVTVTRSAIAENDVTNLTTDLANAQNKIPSGSENSATLASIWVE